MMIRQILLCSASLLACAGQLHAQDTASSPAAPASDTEIIVTGSRVVKNGDSSPSPVTVVSTSDLLTANPGASLADALNTLPAFSGSRGGASNPTTVGSAAGGNGSANQVNLRNLGANRTLVLMDGKRVPPTLFNGVVDVDIIPQMLVDRVDVVTGGVSAVYGSDAMSGVVNYIINRKLQGFRADASYGISQYGDAARTDAAIAWGGKLGEKAHLELSYEFRKEDGIDSRASRPWLNQVGVTGLGTAASPYVLQSGLRQKDYPFGGLITSGALSGQTFGSNGVLRPFINGTATGTSAIQIGGDGGYWDSSLLAKLKGHQLFGRFDYDFSDSLHGYVQASGDLKTNSNYAETSQLTGVTISRTNAFLSPALQAQIPASQSTFTYNKMLGDFPRIQNIADSRQWIFTGGLNGKLANFKWSVDYTHGSTTLLSDLNGVINRQKLSAALDAVNSNGQIVCNASLTNSAYSNCVPLNVFGPSSASAAAINYVTDTVHYRAVTRMDDIAGQISGNLFDLWAGPLTAALSGEWRKQSFSSTSSSRPSDLASCTGLRYNCTSTTALDDFQFGELPNGVSQTVWELAGEFDAPLLKDLPLIRAFNLNGAARYTSYNTSGTYWTWKIGGDWHVTNTLRFRVTRSRDIRAPTLYELFSPTNIVTVRPTDLLTGLSPSVPQLDQGNAALKAEIGNTLTAGVVWKPTRRLSFAVDGYHINITNAVTQIAGSTTAFQQACYASGGSSPYCALQVRPNGFSSTAASNAVTQWMTKNINIAEVDTWGVDFEANYSATLMGRPLQARLLAAWQPHVYYKQPDVVTVDQGGVGFGALGLAATPSVRLTGNLRFKPTDNLTVDLTERWHNPMKLGGDPSQVWADNHMGGFATTGITLGWDIKSGHGTMQFYVNVQNLFNATPPIGAYSGNGTRAGLRDGFALGDDPRGRYFTSGVKMKF